MIRRLLLLSVASFWLSSSFSNGQQLSADQSITGNVLNPSDIEGTYDNCIAGLDCWNGTEDGQNPNWSGAAAYWGYGGGILRWTSAINTALETAGMQIDGYTYRWFVKNFDTNYVDEQADGDDYMRISVRVYDKSGAEVWGKQYNLDGTYGWTAFTGTELFDDSLVADDLGDVIIRAEGKDPGNWAGYYGPEFDVAQSYVKFIYSPLPIDPCDAIPVVDPSCENFIGAAPSEDPAVKQLVIIESTGSIPLSEDELAVLASLEEEEEETFEEEPKEPKEEKEENNNVDALAVARNAEANALSDAANTIENTLANTELSLEQDLIQSQQINQQAQNQSQQSMQEANDTQQSSMSTAEDLNQTSGEPLTDTELNVEILDTVDMNLDNNMSTVSEVNTTQNTNTQSSDQQQNNETDNSGDFTIETYNDQQSTEEADVILEITVDTFEIAALDNAINDAVMNLIKLEQSVVREQVEESQQEEELSEPVSNEKEDELVAAALAGSDDEDAQAALLGFNPNFRAYQQPQMSDADFYEPKDIYPGQENYDNPAARLFNGASDATHRQMIRQQYERE